LRLQVNLLCAPSSNQRTKSQQQQQQQQADNQQGTVMPFPSLLHLLEVDLSLSGELESSMSISPEHFQVRSDSKKPMLSLKTKSAHVQQFICLRLIT